MTRVNLGYADEVRVYAYRGVLFLQATGTNPRTGCKNWFQPDRSIHGLYDFMHETPDGGCVDLVVPFNVVDAYMARGLLEVSIRMEKRGRPIEKTLPVIHALNDAEASTFAPVLPTMDFNKLVAPPIEATFRNSLVVHLGTVDIPLGCATLQNPFRKKRMEFYLEVETRSAQDIENAAVSCLKQATVIVALSALLTPLGWAAGIDALENAMAACLVNKLTDILRVSVTHRDYCL